MRIVPRCGARALAFSLQMLAGLTAFAAASTAADCGALASLSLPDTVIKSAQVVAASAPVPEYCKVLGTLEKTIEFEVALPTTQWNGKFFYAGGGGFNGTIPNLSQGLARGYAAAGSDTGHKGANSLVAAWALNDKQAQINYGHRATHLVAVLAKQIVRTFYQRTEQRAYFVGCSNGGKMGLTELQKYPDDFDGVVVGNPVIDRTRLMMSYTYNARALRPAPIPPQKIAALDKATRDACDAQDGLKDGVVDQPHRCAFDHKALTCKAGDGPDCFTAGQVEALEKIRNGSVNSAGKSLYPGFPPGHEEDYQGFITGSGELHSHPSGQWGFQDGFMRYFVFGEKYDAVTEFDFDNLSALAPFEYDQDADLSKFKARGGKLIMYHGWADHSISPLRTVKYYEDVRKVHGADTDGFARLFMVPGLHHCVKGPGPNSFGGAGQGFSPRYDADADVVMALDRWVEQGVAPKQIVATKYTNDDAKQGVARTRPLCPYPQVARWNGSGSIDDAANFACADPDGSK